ncbi:MAG: flippase [Candidatus Scalindua sp.]|nr:flippase [Candidatus Scalindua sp.]
MADSKHKYDFVNNTFFSSIAEFSAVFLYIFSVLVARILGPEDYGIFVFALSFGTIYALFIRFDFLSYLVREIPLDVGNGIEKFLRVIGTQVWLMLFSTSAMIVICLLLPKTTENKIIIFLVSIAMLFHAFKWSFRGVLRGFDHFRLDSLIVLNERCMLLGVAVLAFYHSWTLFAIALAFVLVRFIDFTISLSVVWRKIAAPKCNLSIKPFISTLKGAWPFAVMMLLFMIYNYCDTIMISLMRSDKEVGYYNVAYQVIEGSQLFPSSVTGGLLPLLTINYGINATEYINSLLNFSIEIMFYMAFPLAMFCSVYASGIVNLLYGGAYLPAVPALQVMIWSVIVFFLSVIARCAFYAAKAEKTYALIFGSSVMVNIVLNIPMINFWGFIGACVSTILTEVFVCIVLFIYLKKLSYQYNLLSRIWKPFLVNILLGVPLYFAYLNNIHVLFAGICFVLLYLLTIYFFKLITIGDIRKLRTAPVG